MRSAYLTMLDQRNALTLGMFAFAALTLLAGLALQSIAGRIHVLRWLPALYTALAIVNLFAMIILFEGGV